MELLNQRTNSVLLMKFIAATSYILCYLITVYNCFQEGICRWPLCTGIFYYAWEIHHGLFSKSFNGPKARLFNIICFVSDTPLVICLTYFGNGLLINYLFVRLTLTTVILLFSIQLFRCARQNYFAEMKFISGFLMMTLHYPESYLSSSMPLTRTVPALFCLGNIFYTLSSWTKLLSSKSSILLNRISMIFMVVSSMLYLFHSD